MYSGAVLVTLPSTAIITQSTAACQAAVFFLAQREKNSQEGGVQNDETEKKKVDRWTGGGQLFLG